jgi:hypothetical protein
MGTHLSGQHKKKPHPLPGCRPHTMYTAPHLYHTVPFFLCPLRSADEGDEAAKGSPYIAYSGGKSTCTALNCNRCAGALLGERRGGGERKAFTLTIPLVFLAGFATFLEPEYNLAFTHCKLDACHRQNGASRTGRVRQRFIKVEIHYIATRFHSPV